MIIVFPNEPMSFVEMVIYIVIIIGISICIFLSFGGWE